MRTVLFIDNSVCSNLEQLIKYFDASLSPNSPIYEELLTLQRDGVLTDWLSEGETEDEKRLADILNNIPENLSNSDLMEQLVSAFTNSNVQLEKPLLSDYVDFERFVIKVEDSSCEIGSETVKIEEAQIGKSSIIVEMKVKKIDNENFTIKVFDNDTKMLDETKIRLNDYAVGEIVSLELPLPIVKEGIHHLLLMSGIDVLSTLTVDFTLNETIAVNGLKFKMIYVERNQALDFKIGEVPVTQELWKIIMENNPSHHIKENRPSPKGIIEEILHAINESLNDLFKYYDRCPVEMVSYKDCQKFLEKLNELTGRKFRLPSRKEWLYACEGGLKSKGFLYSDSNNKDEVAWHLNNAGGHTHPVKEKQPNELGIYDMSGNVYEWCSDKVDWEYVKYVCRGSFECKIRNGGIFTVKRLYDNGGSDLIFKYACGGSYECEIIGNGKDVIALNEVSRLPDVGLRLAINANE